ncbi:MAG: hypothetical protein HY372_02165 [Candidatus Andersenbacteria bacterium]|nr:hypothetical protein [Candidatus Andersenbacteria bacterium]
MPASADRIWFVSLAAALAGVTLAALFVFRLAGPLVYHPVAREGLTGQDSPTPHNRINFHDSRRIRQTFRAPAANMSHLGIGVADVPARINGAVLTAELLDSRGETMWRGHSSLTDWRADDITIMPAPIRLRTGSLYTIELSTRGVPVEAGLTLYYESDAAGFPEGEAEVITFGNDGAEQSQPLAGNIRFQVWRWPTRWVIFDTLWRSVAGWLLTGYALALVLVIIFRQRLISLTDRWLAPINLVSREVGAREFVFPVTLGMMLALAVTMPYFTQLDKISTAGDVQRALVYRAEARKTLFRDGEVGLWNPYLCGGEPLLANLESAQMDPFFLLVLLFGENLGLRLAVAATLALGFFGTYLLARRWSGLGRLPALLAGVIFSFSGFQMLAFANGNFAWLPVGFIPWVVYFFMAGLSRAGVSWLSALMLSFIFYGGSLHMALYAVLACLWLAIFLSIGYRSWRPLSVLLLIGLLFIPLAALKLLPAAEVQAVSGAFDRPPPFIQPWSWLGKMLWDRSQLDTTQWRYAVTGENYRWIEYGTYIGVLPAALVLMGVLASRGRAVPAAFTGAGVILLLMTFGEFPWTVLERVPWLYGPLRNPQRARVVWLLMAGIIAGYGLTAAGRWLGRVRHRSAVIAGVVALVVWDLATFHADMYPRLFNLEAPRLKPAASFIRLHESYTDEERGYYKASYENYRAGYGVADMCMPYMMQRGVYARGVGSPDEVAPYRGEAILPAGGTVTDVEVQGNTVRVALETGRAGWLIINQNFFPGWRAEPPREIRNVNGLAAARISRDDHEILFRYRPRSYLAGGWITAAAGALWLADISWRLLARGKSKRTAAR